MKIRALGTRMPDIAPVRPLDEAAALEWLRSQPGKRPTCRRPSWAATGDGSDSAQADA
jgi:hypothetical protein